MEGMGSAVDIHEVIVKGDGGEGCFTCPSDSAAAVGGPDAPGPDPCAQGRGMYEGASSVVRYTGRTADGLRKPDRIISGPHTGLCHPGAIALGRRGSIYVLNRVYSNDRGPSGRAIGWVNSVTVYDSSAQGDEAPVRTLSIESWGINPPHGIAVDRAGFLYVVSDAGQLDPGSIAVFEAGAGGDAEPIRVLAGRHTTLRRPVGLALDGDGRLYVTNAKDGGDDDTIRVFAPAAGGNVAPGRVIAGPQTRLEHPFGIAIDRPQRLYVANSGHSSASRSRAVTVYEPLATGDAAPARVIAGSLKVDRMTPPLYLALDSHDSLFVRSPGTLAVFAPGVTGTPEPARYVKGIFPSLLALDRHDTLYLVVGDSVVVYAPNVGDSARALRLISGPRAGIHGVTGIAVDDRGWLYLAESDSSAIKVYPPGANGDVAPGRTIAGYHTRISNPMGLAVDRRRRLYVANGPQPGGNGALRVYAPNAEGEDDPVRVLAGPATTLAQPMDIEFDSHGDMYLPNTSGNSPGQVAVFRRKAHGNEPPIRTITGPETLLRRPIKLAVGRGDTLYALNIFDWSRSPCVYSGPVNVTVTVYPPGASGDVEPVRSITVTQEGKSVGRERGLNGMRNLVVDRRGAVRLWHPDGEVTFAPGASGAAAPVRSTTESGVPRGAAAGVAVADDGTIYETSVPVSRVCL